MTKKGNRIQSFEEKKRCEAKKKRKKRYKVNYLRLITIAIVIGLLAYFGVSLNKILKLKDEEKSLLTKNEELTQLKENLEARLETINSAEYIEQQAREDLKLVKPNELLFLLPEEKSNGDNEKSEGDNEKTKG